MPAPLTCALGHDLPEGRALCPTCGMGALPRATESVASPLDSGPAVAPRRDPEPVLPGPQPGLPISPPRPSSRRVPTRVLAATLGGVVALGGATVLVLSGGSDSPAAGSPVASAAPDDPQAGPVVYEFKVLPSDNGPINTSTPRGRVGPLCEDILVAARDRDAADADGNRLANFGGSFRLEVVDRGLLASGVTKNVTGFAYDLAKTADDVAGRMYRLGEWVTSDLSRYGTEPSFEKVRTEECQKLVLKMQAEVDRKQAEVAASADPAKIDLAGVPFDSSPDVVPAAPVASSCSEALLPLFDAYTANANDREALLARAGTPARRAVLVEHLDGYDAYIAGGGVPPAEVKAEGRLALLAECEQTK